MTTTTAAATGPMQQPATWDAVAAGFAAMSPWFARVTQEVLGAIPLGPHDRVLDVAAGAGELAAAAAHRVRAVTAVDFSPAMVEETRARAAQGGAGNIQALVMDAQALALPDASFDAAFCTFGFMFFPDRARAFGEILRVLRPGGRAAIATWGPLERRPLMKISFDALREVLPDLPPPMKGDLQSTDECVREMSAAGFRGVTARPFEVAVDFASPAEYLLLIERTTPPMRALNARLGPEGYAELRGRLEGAVARRMPPGPCTLTAEAILTTGER